MIALFGAIQEKNTGADVNKAVSRDSFRFSFKDLSDSDFRQTGENDPPSVEEFLETFRKSSPTIPSRAVPDISVSSGKHKVRFTKERVNSDDFRLKTTTEFLPTAKPRDRTSVTVTRPTTTAESADAQEFPNFPNIGEGRTTPHTDTVQPTTRRGIIRPPRPQIRKIEREEEGEDEDEDEEDKERRRQEAGIKRRKELFEASRQRKLLDSKRRKLLERKRVEKTDVTTPSTTTLESTTTITTTTTTTSTTTTTTVTSSSTTTTTTTPIPTTRSIVTDGGRSEQERVVDAALKAVLGRAVKGNIRSSPLVWAAAGAIYEFVEMEEKVQTEPLPSQILTALSQLTEFLDRNKPPGEEREEEIVLESLNVDTVNSFNQFRLNQRKLLVKESSSTTTTRVPIKNYDDDNYYDDDIFYDDESLKSNDYVHYDYDEEQFRFSFNHRTRFSTTFKPQTIPTRRTTQTPLKETTTVFLNTPFRLQFDPESGLYSTVLN